MLGRDDYVARENISMTEGCDWPDPSPLASVTRAILFPIQALPGRVRCLLSSFRQYVEDQNRSLLKLGHKITDNAETDPERLMTNTPGQQTWEETYRASFEAKFGNLDLFKEVMKVNRPTNQWL